MVNSEYGGIWLLELTNSKLTSQADSSVSSMNEMGMATTNITFLLAKKVDVGKKSLKERKQQTIQGTNSDFWNCEEERTVWKPELGKEKIKRGPDKQKARHNKLWGTGGGEKKHIIYWDRLDKQNLPDRIKNSTVSRLQ